MAKPIRQHRGLPEFNSGFPVGGKPRFDVESVATPQMLTGSKLIGGKAAFALPPPRPPLQLPPAGPAGLRWRGETVEAGRSVHSRLNEEPDPEAAEDEEWMASLYGDDKTKHPLPIGRKGHPPVVGMRVLLHPAAERARAAKFRGPEKSDGRVGILALCYREEGYVWVVWENGYGNWYHTGHLGEFELYERPARTPLEGGKEWTERTQKVDEAWNEGAMRQAGDFWTSLCPYGNETYGGAAVVGEKAVSLEHWWSALQKRREEEGVPGSAPVV